MAAVCSACYDCLTGSRNNKTTNPIRRSERLCSANSRWNNQFFHQVDQDCMVAVFDQAIDRIDPKLKLKRIRKQAGRK